MPVFLIIIPEWNNKSIAIRSTWKEKANYGAGLPFPIVTYQNWNKNVYQSLAWDAKYGRAIKKIPPIILPRVTVARL